MAPKKNSASSSLDDLLKKNTISADSQIIINVLIREFEKVRTEIQDMRGEFMDLLTARNHEIEELRDEVKCLEAKVGELGAYLDDNDAYERRDTVIVTGDGIPEVQRGENCGEITREIMNLKLLFLPQKLELLIASVLNQLTRFQINETSL